MKWDEGAKGVSHYNSMALKVGGVCVFNHGGFIKLLFPHPTTLINNYQLLYISKAYQEGVFVTSSMTANLYALIKVIRFRKKIQVCSKCETCDLQDQLAKIFTGVEG